MNIIKSEKVKLKAKRAFIKKGTCSRTFFYLLNREFGFPKEDEEIALDPLAGGILQQGYQCGMLWGASMAAGAEAFRKYGNQSQTIDISIKATQHIMESFKSRAKSIECEDITNCDFKSKFGLLKFFLYGKPLTCLKLAGKWAPEAIKAANEGLAINQSNLHQHSISCASELLKKMSGNDEEIYMVAGFAGGLGLSGNGCGALAAAIWKKGLELNKKEKRKPSFPDPEMEKILNVFYKVSDYKIECNKICGQQFKSIDDHTQFIKNGGCQKLIDVLAQS
ncbi:MAG: C_GCAxxG_C_C family protein [Mariniphaga sp.]|nr:C_GCAxxG_C_C family protein [Mariniphaga sp.]